MLTRARRFSSLQHSCNTAATQLQHSALLHCIAVLAVCVTHLRQSNPCSHEQHAFHHCKTVQFCSVMQCVVAVFGSVLPCVAVCSCSLAVCYLLATEIPVLTRATRFSSLQHSCNTVHYCSALQCVVAVRCSVLQCVLLTCDRNTHVNTSNTHFIVDQKTRNR